MDMDLKTDDWQACAAMQISGARYVGGGLFTFLFYSKKAGGTGIFTFKGVGLGLGGDASGFVLPHDFDKFSTPWSSLECTKSFSGWELNKAWGRLTDMGGGIGIQYALIFITACPPWSWSDNYFASQSVGGYGAGGAGAGALTLGGGWSYKGTTKIAPKGEFDDYA
jgi:hypothetical protein